MRWLLHTVVEILFWKRQKHSFGKILGRCPHCYERTIWIPTLGGAQSSTDIPSFNNEVVQKMRASDVGVLENFIKSISFMLDTRFLSI